MSCQLRFGMMSLTLAFAVCQASLHAATIKVPQEQKTIQAGINAAESGDIVLVSPGTYRERIQMKPGVVLRSVGDKTRGKLGLLRAEQTIIDGDYEYATGAGVAMAEDSTLDGFTVTGVGDYDEEEWNRHHATQGNQQSHEEIGAPGTAGISVMGVSHCLVKNNIVHHVGYSGIAIMGSEGKTVSPHIYRNVTYRNMGGGIGSMRKSTARIEENVCFENFYAGIGHDDASPLVINNVCYQNIRAGIGISEGASPTVRGNKCYQNRRAGIGVRTEPETRPVIEHNECYDNDMAGIGASEESAPIIRQNKCYRNRLVGIGADSHASPVIIENDCYENGRVGIGQQNGATTILIGNHSHHNKLGGIGFENTEGGRATVINNRVEQNGKISVGIHAGWTVLMRGNTFVNGEGLPPVIMIFEGASATLIENIVSGGGVAGVRVAGKVDIRDNKFQGKTLRKMGPPNFGVWALPGSQVTLSGNQFETWRHALQASESTVTAHSNKVSNFHRTAFVIQKPVDPPSMWDNIAFSDQSGANVVTVDGEVRFADQNSLEGLQEVDAR